MLGMLAHSLTRPLLDQDGFFFFLSGGEEVIQVAKVFPVDAKTSNDATTWVHVPFGVTESCVPPIWAR